MLGDKEGEVEVVKTERVIIELVDVRQEADVFGGCFCQVVFLFCSQSGAARYYLENDITDPGVFQPLRDRNPDLAEICIRWR